WTDCYQENREKPTRSSWFDKAVQNALLPGFFKLYFQLVAVLFHHFAIAEFGMEHAHAYSDIIAALASNGSRVAAGLLHAIWRAVKTSSFARTPPARTAV